MSDFKDSTLILIGHGSTLNAESATPTHVHADNIREKGIFSRVISGFWKEEPHISGVLRGAFTEKVYIVPLFISEGYFTEEVIPREMGFHTKDGLIQDRVQKINGKICHYCEPVGTHESMTEVLNTRAHQTLEEFPFPVKAEPKNTTLFIAGHGTGNNPNSRIAIEDQVSFLKKKNIFSDVHPLFMEEAPKIEECYELSKTKNLVVVPFFISDGLHSYEDIPVMLGEPERIVKERYENGIPTWRNPTEKNDKRVWYTPSIGNEPGMVDVILERVQEAHEWGREILIA